MHTPQEKLEFSVRLRYALNRYNPKLLKPTELSQTFNKWAKTDISTQSVHKWLTGQSVPTMDKIMVLSMKLHVNVNWLRYGIGNMITRGVPVIDNINKFLVEYRDLTPSQQEVIKDTMKKLLEL